MRTLLGIACAAWLLIGSGPATAQTFNECGCYRDESGGCKCTRSRSRCGCPGECEPVGCEQKRERQAEKQAQAELKRIAAKEKKKTAEAAKAARAKKKAEEAGEKADEKGDKANRRDRSLKDALEIGAEEKKK